MPITNDRVAKLREFGFSELASRTYLALLDLGTSEVRDICKVSNVPSSKIYHILDQLQEKGLVTMLPEFPRRYAPVAFEEYLDRLHRDHLDNARTIERERAELASLFPILGNLEVGDKGGFTILRGRRNVLEKVNELLRTTERDWLVVGTPMSPLRQVRHLPDYAEAKARGVRLRLVSPVTPENLDPLLELSKVLEVHARQIDESAPASRVAFFISDSSRAFLVTYDPDDMNLYAGKDIGIFTDHEAMVKAFVAMVESHWEATPTLEARWEELTTGRAPEFTRFHTTFEARRQAFLQAVERGVGECLHLNTQPVHQVRADLEALAPHVRAHGTSFRAILNVTSREDAAFCERLLRENPRGEIRHLDLAAFSRFTVLDDREALFSLARPEIGDAARPGAMEGLFIHTNNLATVRSLREHFEELWTKAVTIQEWRAVHP